MSGRWSRCRRRGHKWFPGVGSSEFIPLTDICLRCRERRVTLPWGACLGGGHSLSAHYNPDGTARAVEGCGGPS